MKKVILIIFLFSACSPTKGYLGPELPETELSVAFYKDCDANVKKIRASTEGVDFGASGVSVLPGNHNFDVYAELPERPYDCYPQTVFDQSGFDSCISNRDQAIAKQKKYIPQCNSSDYQKTTYWCMQNFKQFVCNSSTSLIKGSQYNVCATLVGGFLKLRISEIKTGKLTSDKECSYINQEVRRLEFDESY